MSDPVTICLKVKGLPCWHRVRVHPLKLPLLRRLQAGEAIDVARLGEVLESGWGVPPARMIDSSPITA